MIRHVQINEAFDLTCLSKKYHDMIRTSEIYIYVFTYLCSSYKCLWIMMCTQVFKKIDVSQHMPLLDRIWAR